MAPNVGPDEELCITMPDGTRGIFEMRQSAYKIHDGYILSNMANVNNHDPDNQSLQILFEDIQASATLTESGHILLMCHIQSGFDATPL